MQTSKRTLRNWNALHVPLLSDCLFTVNMQEKEDLLDISSHFDDQPMDSAIRCYK